MCSKCNGPLNDKPRSAKELLEEVERRKKRREDERAGTQFIEENFR